MGVVEKVPVPLDDRVKPIGVALWAEDEAGLLAALRAADAWPRRGMLLENLSGERLLGTAALFVQVVRSKGWPKSASNLMYWCERQGMGVRGPAWHEERKRRDAKHRPGREVVEAAGVDPGAFRVPQGEEGVPDLSQMR